MTETGELNFILIDDNDIDIVVNSKLLKLANFSGNIMDFSSCEETLSYFEANCDELSKKNNVILLDIQMPMIDGFGCLDRFEGLPEHLKKSMRIFMLSSSIDRNDIERAENNPAVLKVLEKPLDVYLLKRLLEE